MDIPPQCQGIQDTIIALEAEIADVVADMKTDPDPALKNLLHRLSAREFDLRDELAGCIANSLPHFPPLEARFKGTATLSTDRSGVEGPFSFDLRLPVLLNETRTVITIIDFPAIRTQIFDTPVGEDQVTVTQTDGGSGGYQAGAIELAIGLHLEHSNDLVSGSDLHLTLTTNPPGAPVHPEPFGAVTLTGSGTFTGGYLGGANATLVVTGAIGPNLPVAVPDLLSETRKEATDDLAAVELVAAFLGSGSVHALVVRQSPFAGAVAQVGDAVTLTMSTGPFK